MTCLTRDAIRTSGYGMSSVCSQAFILLWVKATCVCRQADARMVEQQHSSTTVASVERVESRSRFAEMAFHLATRSTMDGTRRKQVATYDPDTILAVKLQVPHVVCATARLSPPWQIGLHTMTTYARGRRASAAVSEAWERVKMHGDLLRRRPEPGRWNNAKGQNVMRLHRTFRGCVVVTPATLVSSAEHCSPSASPHSRTGTLSRTGRWRRSRGSFSCLSGSEAPGPKTNSHAAS